MNKKLLLSGMLIGLLALGLMGCNPEADNVGGNKFISLESGGTNILKITLSGTTFKPAGKLTFPDSLDYSGDVNGGFTYSISRVSDTEIAVTLGAKSKVNKFDTKTYNGKGTVRLHPADVLRIDDVNVNTGEWYRQLTTIPDYTTTTNKDHFLEIDKNKDVPYDL
jgi:hypothetical protein